MSFRVVDGDVTIRGETIDGATIDPLQYADLSGGRLLLVVDPEVAPLLKEILAEMAVMRRHLEEITCTKFDETDTRE